MTDNKYREFYIYMYKDDAPLNQVIHVFLMLSKDGTFIVTTELARRGDRWPTYGACIRVEGDVKLVDRRRDYSIDFSYVLDGNNLSTYLLRVKNSKVGRMYQDMSFEILYQANDANGDKDRILMSRTIYRPATQDTEIPNGLERIPFEKRKINFPKKDTAKKTNDKDKTVKFDEASTSKEKVSPVADRANLSLDLNASEKEVQNTHAMNGTSELDVIMESSDTSLIEDQVIDAGAQKLFAKVQSLDDVKQYAGGKTVNIVRKEDDLDNMGSYQGYFLVNNKRKGSVKLFEKDKNGRYMLCESKPSEVIRFESYVKGATLNLLPCTSA